MNFENYTQKSLEAVQSAQKIAQQNHHQQLEQLHLLLALSFLRLLHLLPLAEKAWLMERLI